MSASFKIAVAHSCPRMRYAPSKAFASVSPHAHSNDCRGGSICSKRRLEPPFVAVSEFDGERGIMAH
jgi:hypothetical protein